MKLRLNASPPKHLVLLYLTVAAVPILVLLAFQYESISRQRSAIRALTVANLRLVGERLAEEVERDYRDHAEDTLRGLLFAFKANDSTHERMKAYFQGDDRLPLKSRYNNVFVVRAHRLAYSAADSAPQEAARLFLENNIQLLRSQQTGKGSPLAFIGPPPAQFFYLEKESGDYIVLPINLNWAITVIENERHILDIENPVQIVSRAERRVADGVLVPFRTIFPFWQLAILPTGQPTQDAPQIAIFAGFTSATLILLGFGLLLVTRANWREWRLNQVREEVVSEVSHRLRTPLGNILIYSEMLVRGGLGPDRVCEFHEIVFRHADRLSIAVKRLLEFSRLQSAKRTFHLSSCDLRLTITKAIEDIEAVAGPSKFQINVTLPVDLPQILCDPDAIEQCLANLLENAVKFSGDSRRIDVAATTGARGITIAIRDYGIGIPRERRGEIFKEFYRVESTRTEGFGLGLYIVKSFMDAHHGRVEVDSEPGHGSEFRLVFPNKCRRS